MILVTETSKMAAIATILYAILRFPDYNSRTPGLIDLKFSQMTYQDVRKIAIDFGHRNFQNGRHSRHFVFDFALRKGFQMTD